MPLALVHVHPDSNKVLGVWLSPTSSAYLRTKDGGEARTLGASIMESRGSAPTWDEWARHLAQRTPTVALWRAIPRKTGEEPRHVLARAVALEAVENRKRSPQ
ncbi:MAG: hypothetical protein WC054_01015 [Candidatus Nanopelagicales bacterium]